MLAGAARAYVNQYAVCAGVRRRHLHQQRFGLCDGAGPARVGVQIVAVVDPRSGSDGALPERARAAGIEHSLRQGRRCGAWCEAGDRRRCRAGRQVRWARRATSSAAISSASPAAGARPCTSTRNPAAAPSWNEKLAAFVPGASKQAERSAGAAAGDFALVDCLAGGLRAGAAAAQAAGFGSGVAPSGAGLAARDPADLYPLWSVPSAARGKRFVDIQDDVTVRDVALAAREGYRSVEHLKRYTTLGMGTDQGKTSNINGLALLAELRGEAIPAVGTTTFRPPYTPVTLGDFAGRETGRAFRADSPHGDARLARCGRRALGRGRAVAAPEHLSAARRDGCARRYAARCWRRASRSASSMSRRSARSIFRDRDAAEFLDRVYSNTFSTLPVGTRALRADAARGRHGHG